MSDKIVRSRRLEKITNEEDSVLRNIARHYKLPYDKATQTLRMFLADVEKYDLLSLIEKEVEDDYLNIPINIVNTLARSKMMSNKKSGKKSPEDNDFVKRNEKAKNYPVLLQAAAYIIGVP